jgi:hypothetical protein
LQAIAVCGWKNKETEMMVDIILVMPQNLVFTSVAGSIDE